jgi:hypothetical protein
MNRQPTALMLSLIALLLAVIGLTRLQKVWKHILIITLMAGAIFWWIIYFDLLSQSLR